MTYQKVMSLVWASPCEMWAFNEDRGIFTFKDDVNLRIHRLSPPRSKRDLFGEPWAERFQKDAFRVEHEIYYGASFIESFCLIAVDGGRALLPMPSVGTTTVARLNYNFAAAVVDRGTLDKYLGLAGLAVSPDDDDEEE